MFELEMKAGSAPELERSVLKKIYQLSKDPNNKALGERLFVDQELKLAPFEAVSLTGWGDWEWDPHNNRSWQWRLNWLSFLSYQMAYHRSSGDDAVLDSARYAIKSWLDTYLETDASVPFEFIWHDHATALRAEQLVFFAYYCNEFAHDWGKRNVDFFDYLKQALVVHGQWLAKKCFYSEHTNHGLEQARVLLLLGTVLLDEQAHEWQRIAIRRIGSELDFAFTDEGVHVENSPAYHVFVFKVFLGIIQDYSEEVLGDLAQKFHQLSAKALTFITHILRPDSKLPPIGDTEQLSTSDAYRSMFGHTEEYQHLLYALTQGKQGAKPDVLNRIYPRSGYAIFRDHWPTEDHYTKAFHLVVKVGCKSRYHHQQDEGHVSLYAGGEDWLIDSGLYNYVNKDPVRKYMRSRMAHNVPIFSDASYDNEFEHRLGAWRVIVKEESPPTPSLVMRLGVMLPVTHDRRVVFHSAKKILEIDDLVASDDNLRRNIKFQWHFPIDKTLTIHGDQVAVTSPLGNRLTIDIKGDKPDDMSILAGRKGKSVKSLISYKVNEVESSQLLTVLFKDRSSIHSITRFYFDMADDYIAPDQPED